MVGDMSEQAIPSHPQGRSQPIIPAGTVPRSEANAVDWNYQRRSLRRDWWPLTWWRRYRFRVLLREYHDEEHLLRDIGIDVHEAQSEAVRPFWRKVVLARRQYPQVSAAQTLDRFGGNPGGH